MNAIAATRERQQVQQPARASEPLYLASDVAHAVADDALYFLNHPGAHHRIRKATPSEVRAILERRPLEPTDSCEFVALIHLAADGRRRRRVLVQSFGIDLATIRDDEIASLFDNIVAFGWIWIGDLP